MLRTLLFCLVAAAAAFAPGSKPLQPTQRAAIASAPVANAKTAEEECRIPVWFEVEEQPETPEFSCYPKKDGSKWVCASDHDLRVPAGWKCRLPV
jgi:hypothetical protein